MYELENLYIVEVVDSYVSDFGPMLENPDLILYAFDQVVIADAIVIHEGDTLNLEDIVASPNHPFTFTIEGLEMNQVGENSLVITDLKGSDLSDYIIYNRATNKQDISIRGILVSFVSEVTPYFYGSFYYPIAFIQEPQDVTVIHRDKDTQEVLKTEVFEGDLDETLQLKPLSFDGYQPINPEFIYDVTFSASEQSFIFEYKKDLVYSTIQVNHVDEKGNIIHQESHREVVGTKYEFKPMVIKDYETIDDELILTGVYLSEDQTFVIQYHKIEGVPNLPAKGLAADQTLSVAISIILVGIALIYRKKRV